MALPKIETPTYELTLPSQDTKIKYRPFLVKEEKVLLMASETGQQKEMIQAVKDIVSTCTFNKLNASLLPIFDLEYVFLQIRAKSVGEVTKFKVLCPDDKKTYAEAEVDLSKVEVQVDDGHTNKIILDEERNLGVVFTYPTVDTVSVGEDVQADSKTLFKVLVNCIDHIFEGDKTYPAKDSTKEELDKFVEGLTQNQFEKFRHFFETMPKLKHDVEVTNPKTNVTSKVTLQGIQDFFGSASPTIA
jgi:hypothetical protein